MAKVLNSTFSGSFEVDPTDMLIQGSLSDFFLMRSSEIGYLCMFAYTFLHGTTISVVLWINSISEGKIHKQELTPNIFSSFQQDANSSKLWRKNKRCLTNSCEWFSNALEAEFWFLSSLTLSPCLLETMPTPLPSLHLFFFTCTPPSFVKLWNCPPLPRLLWLSCTKLNVHPLSSNWLMLLPPWFLVRTTLLWNMTNMR